MISVRVDVSHCIALVYDRNGIRTSRTHRRIYISISVIRIAVLLGYGPFCRNLSSVANIYYPIGGVIFGC